MQLKLTPTCVYNSVDFEKFAKCYVDSAKINFVTPDKVNVQSP